MISILYFKIPYATSSDTFARIYVCASVCVFVPLFFVHARVPYQHHLDSVGNHFFGFLFLSCFIRSMANKTTCTHTIFISANHLPSKKCRPVISVQISYENWLLTRCKPNHHCTQYCSNYIVQWTNGVCKWIDIFVKMLVMRC